MSESVVLILFGNNPLLLESVRRDIDGRIVQGNVVNGGWKYKRLGNTAGAFDFYGHTVNQWEQKAEDEREVVVPSGVRGDYNNIIAWALKQPVKHHYDDLTGDDCSICGEPQFMTPSGVTCGNGHGGAEPIDPGFIPEPER